MWSKLRVLVYLAPNANVKSAGRLDYCSYSCTWPLSIIQMIRFLPCMMFVFLLQVVVVWNNVDVDLPPCEFFSNVCLFNLLIVNSLLDICSNYHGMVTEDVWWDDFDFVRLCVGQERITHARIRLGWHFPKSLLKCPWGVRKYLKCVIGCVHKEAT